MECLALYQLGVDQLQSHSIPEAELEASLFLAFILDVPRSSILLNLETCSSADISRFKAYVSRRCQHEPFAYITGWQEFWSLDFKVTPDVLIPRPETELIIEQVQTFFPDLSFNGQVLDCGTGSGVLPVTLATLYPRAEFTSIDISTKALAVAAENSRLHHVSDRISFVRADFMVPFEFKQLFDIIVSNPPYVDVASFPSLQSDVINYEPHVALDGGEDGFAIPKHLLGSLGRYLKPGGHLFMEIGYDQQQRALDMLRSLPFYGQYKVINDYAGLPRMIHAVKA